VNVELGETFVLAIGEWQVVVASGVPLIIDDYRDHARWSERFPGGGGDDHGFLFVGIQRPREEWPSLVVTQSFGPAEMGFNPGVLIVPATERVFIGAGTRILCYAPDGLGWRREWEEETSVGFCGWRQHGDVVVMSEELELAAWTTDGRKLWRRFVEPPWSYTVADGVVRLDVMGAVSEFPLREGPRTRGRRR
jgi:hypothetical protein